MRVLRGRGGGVSREENIAQRWWSPDPLAEKHYNVSPYAYVLNNPMIYIDPFGLDTVYVFDQARHPVNNSTEAQTYTATIYVEQNGMISPDYRGSSFPNNNTTHRTVDEGEYDYNNQYGHDGGRQQGLNLVDSEGNRLTPGTNSSGEAVTMRWINVHSGQAENNNNTFNRGSAGCITLSPNDAAAFMNHFDWSGTYNNITGNTGTSTGTIIILRGNNATGTRRMVEGRREWQQNRLTPLRPRPARLLR